MFLYHFVVPLTLMENIKHIFFDLDRTLWDFDKNSELTFKQIFKEQNIRLNFNDFLQTYTPINFGYWKRYREEKISKPDLRYGRLKDTFNELHFKASDALINKISEDYLTYLPNYNHLINGAMEVLEYLHPKYQLHIITNGFYEVQTKKIKASNIEKYFAVVVTSESVGVKKPNPKVFEFALKQAGASPQDAVMIGDNLEADINGAFACGILPIYFTNNNKTELSNFATITKLKQLKQYL